MRLLLITLVSVLIPLLTTIFGLQQINSHCRKYLPNIEPMRASATSLELYLYKSQHFGCQILINLSIF